MTCTLRPQSIELPTRPESARAAREFLAGATCDRHEARVLDEAQLLVSELVGNAIRHGAPPIEVEVCCVGRESLQVRVRDSGTGVPLPRDADSAAEGGRGLALVDLISTDWGTDRDPEGKTVWFRLDVA